MCAYMCGGQKTTFRNQFFPSQYGFQGLKSGHQRWHQVPLSAEPSDWPQVHQHWTDYFLMHKGNKSFLKPVPGPLSKLC